jgi:L-histidine Nalpha-methyltransferase
MQAYAVFKKDFEESQIARPYPKASPDFRNAVISLFRGQEAGNLFPYMYGERTWSKASPELSGEECWRLFLNSAPEHYCYSEEAALIQASAAEIGRVVNLGSSIVELGVGSTEAIEQKTLPLLNALRWPRTYTACDLSAEFAETAATLVDAAFPLIRSETLVGDYTKAQFFEEKETTPLLMQFGGTLFNVIDDYQEDTALLQMYTGLVRFSHMLPLGGYFLLSQDANADGDDLIDAYKKAGPFVLNVLHRIKRELRPTGFDPDAFVYVPRWDAVRHLLIHDAVATKTQKIMLLGEQFEIGKGQALSITHSLKCPVPWFQALAEKAGFSSERVFTSPSGRMVLHLLKAR